MTGIPRRTLRGELTAEFFGTFIFLVCGLGAIAQLTIYDTGSLETVAWAWGLAVAFAIYISGGISGAHLNPAVTLAFACRRGFPWRKVLPYITVQTLAAFFAAALIRWEYSEAISQFDPDRTKGLTIFTTQAQDFVSNGGALRNQIIATALLLIIIAALIDARNAPPMANLAPLLIGLSVTVGIMVLAVNGGYAINPARDFGPRLLAWLCGYSDAFTAHQSFWWVPIAGPLIGGPLGILIYDAVIGRLLPWATPEIGRNVQNPDTHEVIETASSDK
ncbi:MIP family channel protein [Gordonia sp. HNM0687]|uniref:MIP family channel protein n=1 Tax=Gordonia mangrovi TaxID=2665643 RepID=A0A6L7GSB6_9ACTN|nr:MIP family channel protein [Gordonia mangrovi]MXP21438.1 MIP family channel protein [Gordonia mangrovi]UVF80185.1 MIP family channel protein [Gordonia mangrovi]